MAVSCATTTGTLSRQPTRGNARRTGYTHHIWSHKIKSLANKRFHGASYSTRTVVYIISASHLLVHPLRLGLLRKRLHPDLLVLAAEQAVEHTPLVVDTIPQRQVLALVHNLLARLHGHLAVASNRLGRVQCRLDERLIVLEAPRCHTPLLSLHTAEALPGEDQLHSSRLAHGSCEALASPGSGNCAELDLRLSEVGGLGAVEDISHERELTAAAEGVSRDRSDERLGEEAGQVGPRLDELLSVGLGEGEGGHLLNVCASGEGALGAGEDDGADRGGGLELAEGVVEFGYDGGREGIERLGAVEGNCIMVLVIVGSQVTNVRSIEAMRLNWKNILCATPGRGSDVRISSYCCFAEAEKGRVTLGRDDGLNWETLGLIHLTVFIMIATLYLTI